MEEKITKIGEMTFWYDDLTEDRYNETTHCSFDIYGNFGEGLNIEEYYYFCKRFAAAIGFGDETINKWFGDY